MKVPKQIAGQKFGRLTAIKFESIRNGNKHYWECLCDCGNSTIVQKTGLMSGHVVSCGCFRKEVTGNMSRTHGKRKDNRYNIWILMKSRCHDVKDQAYHYYGARGIKVCDKWRESFENFIADIGPRPSLKHSIDRIDCDGDYCPENCRWATQKEQLRNYSRNVHLEYEGTKYCLKDLCLKLGLSYGAIDQRWKKRGIIEIPGATLIQKNERNRN